MANNTNNNLETKDENKGSLEHQNSGSNFDELSPNANRREINRFKDAVQKFRKTVNIVLAPVMKYIKLGILIAAVIILILVFLSASLMYIWEKITKQDTEDASNLPGTTKQVMTANAAEDPNTGEVKFEYKEDTSSSGTSSSGSSEGHLNNGTTSSKDYIVKTDESGAARTVTKDELLKIIDGYNCSEAAKKNLKDNVGAFIDAQENYKVNAVFLMAITIKESSAGTDWNLIDSSTYNWMSMKGTAKKGSYVGQSSGSWRKYASFAECTDDVAYFISTSGSYFGGGKYKVSEIAIPYCDANWGNKVNEFMKKFYDILGTSGGSTGVGGLSAPGMNPTSGNSKTNKITSLDNFLFIGDSRYAGIDSYIKALGNNIKNAGVSSSNIDEWVNVVKNSGKGTVQGKSVDISGKYSGISIQLGANGVYNNVDNTVNSMKSLIQEVKKLYPNTPIFVNSCVQVNSKAKNNGYTWDPATFKDNVNSFNKAVQDYCNTVDNVTYIDISTNLNDTNGYLKDEYTDDGLHCNSDGAKIFAENIKNAITNTKTNTTKEPVTIDSLIKSMTLEEKIYQMMMAQSAVSDGTQLSDVKFGGYIVGSNSNYQNNLGSIGSNYKIPLFIATDDEGGSVTRAASQFKTNARTYGDNKDYAQLLKDEKEKSDCLLDLGINLNLGPVTDVISNSSGALYKRSFSGEPSIVEKCITKILEARKNSKKNGVSMSSALKHYPGYPDTSTNTDFAEATSNRSKVDIDKNIEVFKAGISSGAQAVMVSNVIYENYDSKNPATLSSEIIGNLRKDFKGVIMTDDISTAGMSNQTGRYKRAIIAGNDMILIGNNSAQEAYNEINKAITDGEIKEDRINESVKRILQWKVDVGLLKLDEVDTTSSEEDEEDDENFLIMTDDVTISKNDDDEWCIATELNARVDEIYKIMLEEDSTALKFFDDEDEMKEAIKLWIVAEYSTQFVNLSSDVENYKYDPKADYIQGVVKVKRYEVDDSGKEKEKFLTYKPPEEFKALETAYEGVTNDDEENAAKEVFNHFTLDEEGNLIIAQYTKEIQTSEWTDEADPNGELDQVYTKRTIYEQKLNYRDFVRNYTMPFNLLWAMVVYGKDVSFSNELAKLVIDSEVVIGIRDNVTTTVTTTIDKYLKEEKLKEYLYLTVRTLNLPSNISKTIRQYFYEYLIEPGNTTLKKSEITDDDYKENADKTALEGINESIFYEKTTVNTMISNSAAMQVEYVDSWFAEYKMEYNANHIPGTDKSDGGIPQTNTAYELDHEEKVGPYDETGNDSNSSIIKTIEEEANKDEYAKNNYTELKQQLKDEQGFNVVKAEIQSKIEQALRQAGQYNLYYDYMWNNGQIVTDVIMGSQRSYSNVVPSKQELETKYGYNFTVTYETTGDEEKDEKAKEEAEKKSNEAYNKAVGEIQQRCREIYQGFLNTYNRQEQERIKNEKIRATHLEITREYYVRTVNRTIETIINIDRKEFNKGETKTTEKTDKKKADNFVGILDKTEHIKAYKALTGSISSWFFKALEKNKDTEPYIDLIKYLFYKLTDIDFGVTEFDMSSIKFYVPKTTGKSTGIIRGDTVQAKVWFAMKGMGLDDEHAAAVMGNIHWESGGFSPSAIEGDTGIGIGLIQWSYDRRTALENYAASKGKDWKDEDTQIEFLIGEMTPGGGADGYATYQFSNGRGYTPNDWYNATSIDECTTAFCYTFERPGVLHLTDRLKWAHYYYDEFHGKVLSGVEGEFVESADAGASSGIAGTFTSGGRVYTIYIQTRGPWVNEYYYFNGATTIGSSACGMVSTLNVASGFGGCTDTPTTFRDNYTGPNRGWSGLWEPMRQCLINNFGADSSIVVKNRDKADMISHLQQGHPLIVLVHRYYLGSHYYGGHYFTILGISDDGTQVFVGDSGGYGRTGWYGVDEVIKAGLDNYLAVY